MSRQDGFLSFGATADTKRSPILVCGTINSMFEKIPKKSPESQNEIGFEWHTGSEEEPSISKDLYDLVGVVHRIPHEELRNKLIVISDKVARLEEKSRTDGLTGLLNRNGFSEEMRRLEAIFAREQKDGIRAESSLLAIDLDGFKEVNDSCGHACGDRCLSLISEKVKGVLRDADVFARVGGDEFSVFFIHHDEDGALHVAEKVRSVIEREVTETLRKEFPNYKGNLSASIGVVTIDGKGFSDNDKMIDDRGNLMMEKVIKYADYASYVVKAAGKHGELTLKGAKEIDKDGQFERDFLSGKTLPR